MRIYDRIDSNFLYYLDQGDDTRAYEIFGAHLVYDEAGKKIGCEFCLYAPNAIKAGILGEWNNFSAEKCQMQKINSKIWYLYLEGDFENKRYKYELILPDGSKKYKSDPYAFYSALRPLKDSIVYEINGYDWHDDYWMYTHPKVYDKPMLIYELHLGSWKRKSEEENVYYTYRELAPMLIDYLKDFGYTHIEFMPVYEHPLDASWGYQGTGYYSATSRYGTPKDLMYLVDMLHQAGYGVIFDWVPGHICKDENGLYLFDGTPLYDYPDPNIRENLEWGTANLDLGKGITRSFLYSNAMFFLKYYHIDGFRVDAVSNIIYYMGNKNRGENKGACDFLRELSRIIFGYDDRVLLMAEDSSDYPGVTKPSSIGGLGFNYKWDMGWMNDTLTYFKRDPIYRKYHHNQLTFSMMYNYSEQFILPLSHDEVVHGKKTLLDKMPGDYWQKFANFRLLMGYTITHPGKKLIFMGQEMAPFSEWAFQHELDWVLLKFPAHDSTSLFMKHLTCLYKNEPAMWSLDHDPMGFKYLDADNANQSLYVYVRFSKKFDEHIVVVMNATPNTYQNYKIGVPGKRSYYEIFNSDRDIYGGSNKINPKALRNHKEEKEYMHSLNSIFITIPPLGICMFKMKCEKNVKKKTSATNNIIDK